MRKEKFIHTGIAPVVVALSLLGGCSDKSSDTQAMPAPGSAAETPVASPSEAAKSGWPEDTVASVGDEAITFSLLGFVIGIWANGFEQLQIVPLLVITPLTFLGGTFYSIDMLPPTWQKISLFNPIVYLISGFRWSFYENADVSVALSLGMTVTFLVICLLVVRWIFRTGYRLRT